MLTVRLNGRSWLEDIGPFGEITYSENHLHGCESAAWSMRPNTRHRDLHAGATVQVYEGSLLCWTGYLQAPGRDGTFRAGGWWKLGQGVNARNDFLPGPTTNPWHAARNALLPARGGDPTVGSGAVPWYGPPNPTDFNPTLDQAFGDTNTGDLTLTTVLDRYTESTGSRWRVDHTGMLGAQPAPTTPRWSVDGIGDIWTWADEEYATRLNVTYMSGASTFARFQRTTTASLAAEARSGRQERSLDLTGRGIITLAAAQAAADAVLADTGGRMTLAEPVTVQRGQLRTIGGTAAGWATVHAGQVVRLWGVPDRSRPVWTPYTDFVIDRLDRGTSTLTLAPPSLPPRNVADVIAKMAQLS